MKNEFIPYEQALALKNLGFDEPCLAAYLTAGRFLDISEYVNHGDYRILAPLYQQAFRWFREKHGLRHFIEFDDGHYNPVVQSSLVYHCDTYEEAELACLNKLIILITPVKL
jgi:hypothetical protein